MSSESESSHADIKQFIHQPGDDYNNGDIDLIKQQLHPVKVQTVTKSADHNPQPQPEGPKIVPIKNLITSTWRKEDDELLLRLVQDEATANWEKISTNFANQTAKSVKYQFQVVQQVWSSEQQQVLADACRQHLQKQKRIDWKEIALLVKKSKTQCQKHYTKLIAGSWTADQDLKITRLVLNKIQTKELQVDAFSGLEQELLIQKQQIHERYLALKKKSDDLDRFWFKASDAALQQWWKSNKDETQKKVDELLAVCRDYDAFDVQRQLVRQGHI